MKPSIYLKFIFAWLIFGLLGFLTIALLSSRLTLNYLITDNANALYREANLISNQYTQSLSSSQLSTEDVTLQLQAIDHFTSSVVWIVNKDGQVIYDSRNASEGAETADFVIEGFDATDIGSKNYMIGTFYDSFPQEMLSVLSPINNGFQVVSYVVIHTPYAEIVTRKDELLNIVYITGGILYLLSLIPLIVFTFAVYRPIKKIAAATGEYANGNLDYSIKHTGSDEIGKLADSLNFMASRLSESEEDQKRFIANVSHDFRSPLTSIRGYLEAMVDGTIPPELHEKYINIVLNETGRLTKLTNSLLSLNNLSDKGMLLEKTDFDINSAIKHTAETFEGTCKQKLLRIRLILTGDTMFVYADKGKIEQVVYNLIDNAIKFSNQNSEIKVETTEKNETVFVSVKDSGIGIPKESVKYIFDRFYKSDNSRGKDKKGTGLGLSIVKEILNAHNENINVISTEGVGSEFIFTLPKSREFND
ncbi:MAG: HAMP domain-containing histidine kinase [Lachnospiraceae bacterium]|nr:HAMP domain-containing histidine kinase [Lachnospiraceae bacterium]